MRVFWKTDTSRHGCQVMHVAVLYGWSSLRHAHPIHPRPRRSSGPSGNLPSPIAGLRRHSSQFPRAHTQFTPARGHKSPTQSRRAQSPRRLRHPSVARAAVGHGRNAAVNTPPRPWPSRLAMPPSQRHRGARTRVPPLPPARRPCDWWRHPTHTAAQSSDAVAPVVRMPRRERKLPKAGLGNALVIPSASTSALGV